MKTETFELEKLKVELLPELQGWKEKQKAIVKGNPFVKIEDTKTYRGMVVVVQLATRLTHRGGATKERR